MRELILSTLSILILMMGYVVVFSQQKPVKTNPVEPNQPLELSQYKDWKKIELSAYSFYVPKDFKLAKIQGVDAAYWEYKSEDIDFGILEGTNVGNPNPIRDHSSKVKYTSLSIEGVSAQMVSYEDESKDYKYVRAIEFRPPKWKITWVSISLVSKDVEGQELAKKIFDSIRFKDSN